MSAKEKATEMLQHYIRRLWLAAGLTWDGDHYAETEGIVDLIIEAARAELPVLDRECSPCKGRGLTAGVPQNVRACESCGGNGYLITDAGRQVIAFLQRHPAALTRVEG